MQIISPAGAPPAFGKLTPSTSSVWLMIHYFTCVNCCFINKLLANREGGCVCVCVFSLILFAKVHCLLCPNSSRSQPTRQTDTTGAIHWSTLGRKSSSRLRRPTSRPSPTILFRH